MSDVSGSDGDEEITFVIDTSGEIGSFQGDETDNWKWSGGNINSQAQEIDYEQEYKVGKNFSNLIEDRIAAEETDRINNVGVSGLSKGAKVKSQWDKTLQSSSKAFLNEIHNQTEQQRRTSSKGGATSAREERVFKLLEKQRQLQADQS